MSHPTSCKDPNCTLNYRDHLLSINLSANALPTRRVSHHDNVPDEPVAQTLIREKRWDRDMAAFKRLHDDGLTPPQIDGSALRERQGETVYDVTERKVKIDYTDPR